MGKAYNVGKNEDGTVKVYDNAVLEFISHTPVYVPIVFYLILSAISLFVAISMKKMGGVEVTLLYFFGIFFFSLIEYCVHRFLFHHSGEKEWQLNLKYKFHGIHHESPKDKGRLVMPLPASIFLAIVLFLSFYIIIETYAYGFIPGILSGYSLYLLVHYIVHAYSPPNNFFRVLWVNHAIHHYKDEGAVFGVSSPLWDYVFGTMSKKATK